LRSCSDIDAGFSSEVSLCGFRVAHLEQGEQDAPSLVHRGVSGELQRLRALAHRGAGRDDVQAPVVKAAEQPVEVVDAGRESGDVAIVLASLL